tara:strand:- start:6 stop:179 length:174 start_codon:yes stop_codon:yes gene_type:complete
MSGDCKKQSPIFYSQEMTLTKKIAIEHALEERGTAYVKRVDSKLYLCRWRNGSVMQE